MKQRNIDLAVGTFLVLCFATGAMLAIAYSIIVIRAALS